MSLVSLEICLKSGFVLTSRTASAVFLTAPERFQQLDRDNPSTCGEIEGEIAGNVLNTAREVASVAGHSRSLRHALRTRKIGSFLYDSDKLTHHALH